MTDSIGSLTTIFTEFYYWVTVVLMFLIHVGFALYEVGVSRRRNHLHTLMKNVMVIPVVTPFVFLFWLVDILCLSIWARNNGWVARCSACITLE